MAPKNTLNAQNLEALGAKRLAELLIEISSGDAAASRALDVAENFVNLTAALSFLASWAAPDGVSPRLCFTKRVLAPQIRTVR